MACRWPVLDRTHRGLKGIGRQRIFTGPGTRREPRGAARCCGEPRRTAADRCRLWRTAESRRGRWRTAEGLGERRPTAESGEQAAAAARAGRRATTGCRGPFPCRAAEGTPRPPLGERLPVTRRGGRARCATGCRHRGAYRWPTVTFPCRARDNKKGHPTLTTALRTRCGGYPPLAGGWKADGAALKQPTATAQAARRGRGLPRSGRWCGGGLRAPGEVPRRGLTGEISRRGSPAGAYRRDLPARLPGEAPVRVLR